MPRFFTFFGLILSLGVSAQVGKLKGEERRKPIHFWNTRGSVYLGLLDDQGVPSCSFGLVGPKLISTAQHCLQDRDLSKIFARLHFDGSTHTMISAISGVIRLSTLTPADEKEIGGDSVDRWPKHNAHGGDDQVLVVLKESFGEHFPWLEFGFARLRPKAIVDLLGYPADKKPNPWGHFGCEVTKSVNFPDLNKEESYVLSLDCDVDYGASGGPVIAYLPAALPETASREIKIDPNAARIPYLVGTTSRVQWGSANSAQDMSKWHFNWSVVVVSQLLDLIKAHSNQYGTDLPNHFDGAELLRWWQVDATLETKLSTVDQFFMKKIEARLITANYQTARYVRNFRDAWFKYRLPTLDLKYGIQLRDEFAPLEVVAVTPGSLAEKAGLKPGHTIQKFGDVRHPALHHLRRQLLDWKASGTEKPPAVVFH